MNIINDLSLGNGSTVDIVEDADSIVIRAKKNMNLDELLENITAENLHSPVDFGNAEGNESW